MITSYESFYSLIRHTIMYNNLQKQMVDAHNKINELDNNIRILLHEKHIYHNQLINYQQYANNLTVQIHNLCNHLYPSCIVKDTRVMLQIRSKEDVIKRQGSIKHVHCYEKILYFNVEFYDSKAVKNYIYRYTDEDNVCIVEDRHKRLHKMFVLDIVNI